MKWNKKDISPEQVKEISVKYGCDLLTASIFVRRGICDGDSIRYFLENDLRLLRNPFALDGMEDAVERILAAKEEGEKVLVFGDSDVDGITGTVIITRYLRELGMDVSWRIPGSADPYGLSLEAVEEFAAAYGTLIITVDCGISRFAEIKRANELSVDVIVTDHHEPQEQLPEAFAIINPKLKESKYPFKDICGCVVAFKLVSALRFAMNSELYAQPISLLNARPLNDAWIVEVAKMRNLSVIELLSETIVPGMIPITDTRLPAFLEGQQILVWDAPLQKKAFSVIFGNKVDIGMVDAAVQIGASFPSVAGKSLVRIKELSAAAKYHEKEAGELEIFISLFKSFVQKKQRKLNENDIYDMQLAALGTIGDIMPLLNENRIIVRRGFKTLLPGNSTKASTVKPGPGISELLDKLELSGSRVELKEIGWKICPVINAARRMGEPEKAAQLFFEKDPLKREKIATELIAMNKKRKVLEDEVWSFSEPEGYKSLAGFNNKFSLAFGTEINKGITGLVAQHLVKRFKVPSIAVSFGDDVYTGSIRSLRGYNACVLLEQCNDLFIDSGGHTYAGGFSLIKENWNNFIDRLKTISSTVEYEEKEDGEIIYIDAELPQEYLNPDILGLIDLFTPYGNKNEELIFLAKNLLVEEINFIGKNESKHLKLLLVSAKHKWPAIFWEAAERVLNKEFGKNDRIDVVCSFTRDWFRGIPTPQMMIHDLRKST